MASPRLFPGLNTSVEEVFRIICDISEQDLSELAGAVSGPDAFDISKERTDALSSKLHLDSTTTRVLLSALNFLYFQVNEREGSEKDAIVSLIQVVKSNKSDSIYKYDHLDERLSILLQKNEFVEIQRKRQRLSSGFLPNAKSFATMVDLRPNFDEPMKNFSELIPIIQFRVATDADDPSRRELVFQLDPKTLEKLLEAGQKAQKKIAALRDSDVLSGKVRS